MAGTRVVGMLTDVIMIFFVELLCVSIREFLFGAKLELIDLHAGFKFFAVDGEKTLSDWLFFFYLALFHHGVFF